MAPDPNSSNGNGRKEATAKARAKNRKKKDGKKYEDLSEEDLALKEQLEFDVEKVLDSDPALQKVALESMRHEIRTSTSSMTSVPKPLKFLRPHYRTLKAYYETMADSEIKTYLADILSVLALTTSTEGERESLKFRLVGSQEDVGSWGHAYVRNLAGEVAQEYKERQTEDDPVSDLMELAQDIVAFHMKHNAEPEAVDLLMEVEDLDSLSEHVDSANLKRTCMYLTSATRYLPEPDDVLVLDNLYVIFSNFEEYSSALQIALFLGNLPYVYEVFTSCDDLNRKKQFCYILARHGLNFMLDDEVAADDEDRFLLQDIINNIRLSEDYLTLAHDTEVMEPMSPEDVYKAHLLDGRASAGARLDYSRQNLASTFVNAFVNAGFGQDNLMTVTSASSGDDDFSENWLFSNVEHGKTSAVAGLGMIFLWDVDSGLAKIEKYVHSNRSHVTAGALLGIGIANCSVKHDLDPALELLEAYVDKEDTSIRIGAIMGLGIAYAGTQNEQITLKLLPILNDVRLELDVTAFTAISLGLIYVGSCDEKVVQAIVYAIEDRSASELEEPFARFLPLALGLLYLGKQGSLEEIAEVVKKFNKKIREYCEITVLSCAYAGTGDVLTVQKLLGHCAQHLEKGETHQGPAVLGIAMVAMAEELGIEMAIRSLEHLLQYGEQAVRRAVPLALGLLCISNPKVNVMNTLSRLSHDKDSEVAMAAIISLGLIGAGTNNARIADMLRKLSCFYYRFGGLLFCVRIAQGLVYLGKGLLTLNPYHSDRFLLSPTQLAGLVTTLHACLDMKAIASDKYHYVLYFLALAMQPRMLMTVDENLKPLSVPVRVGKAVDVVGQAGQPKVITAFRTLSTPVILAAGERAELATEKYLPLSPILEGFVILEENPEYTE